MKIKIKTPHGEIKAKIDNKKNPRTAKAIADALPITGRANVWGDEIYFDIPAKVIEEDSQQDVEVGDLAYWPPGNALCIFFGRTPISTSANPRAYSPVNVFGRVSELDDIVVLKQVRDGEEIKVEADKI